MAGWRVPIRHGFQVLAQMLNVAVGGNGTFHYSLPFRYFGESVGPATLSLRHSPPSSRSAAVEWIARIAQVPQVAWHWAGNTGTTGVKDEVAPWESFVANEHPCTAVTCPSAV